MAPEMMDLRRVSAADHPENRPAESEPTPAIRETDSNLPAAFVKSVVAMWLAGLVGSLLTLMTVAYPLGAGDTVAALSMLPLAVTLICIVNGWIAANVYLSSGLKK